MRDPRVVKLRERLAATGDLSSDSSADDRVDAEVLAGVEHFQIRHGLDFMTYLVAPLRRVIHYRPLL